MWLRLRARFSARLIHVSAIGADAQSASAYARSKAQGEAAVRAAVPDAIILRPSIIFGQDDSFFNRFAGLSTVSPVLPLIGGGQTLFQPVYVGDVAEAVLIAADGCAKPGTTYELGGPQQSSFRSLLETLCEVTGRKPLLLPVPFFAAQIMGRILGLLPNPQLTEDQVELLKSDNVVSEEAVKDQRTLEGLVSRPKAWPPSSRPISGASARPANLLPTVLDMGAVVMIPSQQREF